MKTTTLSLIAAALGVAGLGTFAATTTAGEGCCASSAKAATQTIAYDGEKADKDIVETALAAGQFNTLATALTEAGLVDTLQGDGPFTVFAPTDEAFDKLPEGTLEGLLADKEALKNVLLYHVVSGAAVPASEVVKMDGQSVDTANGDAITITVDGDNVMINDNVKVIKTDVKASNGIIHVIDTVIVPGA
jgi:uncharacterized surface protein with fasciclin (FAS1) repeats